MPYSRIGFCLVIYMVPCLRTIDSSGTQCGDYYSIPQRPTTLIRWKVLDFTTDEESGILSMLEALPTIWNVMWYPQELPSPTNVKGICSFMEHAGFYQRFIQNFSQIARLPTHLLAKVAPFVFIEECLQAFHTLMKPLISAPTI
jgi:hypothetical protein